MKLDKIKDNISMLYNLISSQTGLKRKITQFNISFSLYFMIESIRKNYINKEKVEIKNLKLVEAINKMAIATNKNFNSNLVIAQSRIFNDIYSKRYDKLKDFD